ncbi:hypothetical protein BofuT4_uP080100.1 [Botrytis cinerea T4]|uniref:Uncharacterized protein n=1 Tax=Botryotinia fuckeliana (strain T4) TaxID=999810 RepID=G2YKR7_BOTF4|nr:hypothetical protein BofuT4_uP080100.1 [Botrytis cinerea T4]
MSTVQILPALPLISLGRGHGIFEVAIGQTERIRPKFTEETRVCCFLPQRTCVRIRLISAVVGLGVQSWRDTLTEKVL